MIIEAAKHILSAILFQPKQANDQWGRPYTVYECVTFYNIKMLEIVYQLTDY